MLNDWFVGVMCEPPTVVAVPVKVPVVLALPKIMLSVAAWSTMAVLKVGKAARSNVSSSLIDSRALQLKPFWPKEQLGAQGRPYI